jgi:hypothetical protein
MTSAVFEAAYDIQAARDVVAVTRASEDFVHRYSLPRFAVVYLRNTADGALMHSVGNVEEFLSAYRSQNFHRVDPLVLMATRTPSPYV